MDSAFDALKTAGQEQSASKLRYPETGYCSNCLGVCPEPHLDYTQITQGKAAIASLKAKTAPYAALDQTVNKILLSTQDRMSYRDGEEKAAIFAPKYNAEIAKFGGLKAQAVEAKALSSDSAFVAAADAYLTKGDELSAKLDKRDFTNFDYLL
ncbi:Uncharacterised protein [uncultured archaeon]|nr:Uncharacterised protein [uncultured archaeon]